MNSTTILDNHYEKILYAAEESKNEAKFKYKF